MVKSKKLSDYNNAKYKVQGASMERIHLPLQKYSQAQKLDLLETIWDDISKNEEEFKSPDWHAPILAECREELNRDNAELLEWSDDLKAEIKKESLC